MGLFKLLFRRPNWLIGIGILSCVNGMAPNLVETVPVSETPEYIDLDQAVVWGQEKHPRHVEFLMDLDEERRVHPTTLSEPPYTTACAPGEVSDLPMIPTAEALEELRGCVVRASTVIPQPISAEVRDGLQNQTTGEFTVKHLHVFVQIPESLGRVWVVSPDLVGDDARAKKFPEGRTWEGALTRRRDLKENHDEAHRMIETELARVYQQETGEFLPADAWFVLTDKTRVASYEFSYIPVLESDDALFLKVRPDEVPEDAMPISGILERSSESTAKALAETLDTRLPEHVGILTPGGLQAYQDGGGSGFGSLAFGTVCIALGLIYARARRDTTRERHEPRPQIGQPPQAAAEPPPPALQPPPGKRFIRRD